MNALLWGLLLIGLASSSVLVFGLRVPTLGEIQRGDARNGSRVGFVTCPNATNCTGQVQAAFDNAALDTVAFTLDQSPYMVTSTFLHRDHVLLQCEPGVVLYAMPNQFHAVHACLLSFGGTTNVTIRGCTFRMRREDYANRSNYVFSQWRHALSLDSVTDLLIENSTFEGSGGDGIYISGGAQPNTNVIVRNSLIKNSYRNGISVITANGLLVENSLIEGTKGSNPQCGVDLEPNHPSQSLNNVTFRDVLFYNNSLCGIAVSTYALQEFDTSYSVLFENVTVDEAGQFGIIYHVPHSHAGPVLPPIPMVNFTNLAVKNTGYVGHCRISSLRLRNGSENRKHQTAFVCVGLCWHMWTCQDMQVSMDVKVPFQILKTNQTVQN